MLIRGLLRREETLVAKAAKTIDHGVAPKNAAYRYIIRMSAYVFSR